MGQHPGSKNGQQTGGPGIQDLALEAVAWLMGTVNCVDALSKSIFQGCLEESLQTGWWVEYLLGAAALLDNQDSSPAVPA